MNNQSGKRLQRLEESEFEIANKEPDITGWDLVDEKGNALAVVGDLLFDAQTNKVVYMEVWTKERDDDIITIPSLVPIGFAELDKEKDKVIVPGLTKEKLRSMPAFDREEIIPAYEQAIRKAFQQPADQPTTAKETDFYQNSQFNNEHLFDRRRANNSGEDNDQASDSSSNILHAYNVSFLENKKHRPKKNWKPNKDDLFLIE